MRLAAFFAGLIAFVIVAAFLYQIGMTRLEGKPRTFADSLEWATETLSSTGYGFDNHWSHPMVIALVITLQFAGMIFVPLLIPLLILPYLIERFEQRLPRVADRSLVNHVVVYRYGPAVETLLQRLTSQGIASLVAEMDETQAREVLEQQQSVVFGRSDEDILDVCRLDQARALVANGRDEENAAVILRARQMGFRGEIYAFVTEPAHRMPMELAGATAAYTPRHIIAAALAAHASDAISPRLPGLEMVSGLERREIRIGKKSAVAGRTLEEAAIGRESGAVVVGQWNRSHLMTRCTAAMRIEPGAIVELVGDADALQRAAELIGGTYLRPRGAFLIAGFGEVGRKVHELLTDAGEEARVIERQPLPDVDVVGNVLDVEVLERAGLRESRGVILALDSDDATLFAAVIVRDAVSDVPVIARVNHGRNLENIHRAGADYALSISDISGEMLSARLLGRAARARDEHRRVVRIPAARFAGRTIGEVPLRAHGCSALAIERGGKIVSRITEGLRVEAADEIWICGTDEAVAAVSGRRR